MKTQENAWLWLYKIIAGLLIVVLLGIHFIVNHLAAPGGLLTYADVIRYYQVPGIALMEIVFLVFVISHSLVGLRSILLDLHPSTSIIRAANWAFILIGSAAIAYGVWLVIVIQSKG